MVISKKLIISASALVIIAAALWIFGSRGVVIDVAKQDCQQVEIGENEFCLWVADSFEERKQGLSDTYLGDFQSIREADGMIFLFDEPALQNFWMKDMLFDLDVLWIADGEILKIDIGIKAPDFSGEEPERMSSDPYAVSWVIELPSGSVNHFDIKVGDKVSSYQ